MTRGPRRPVVLPDGNVLIGVSTSYNFARGHLLKFNPQGGVLATYDFGWDLTPAVFEHDGTYSILIKDNHYSDPDGITLLRRARLARCQPRARMVLPRD